ncbi:hypothetical protein Q428_02925 [Fervidicella metallireducens AeB]|uniref:CRISPR-associated protein Cas5 n=1 Tax=Fervidicella metallireducens AeB TaxID=1403537 RepID=A0A017RXA9_9CLOT|nr:hypothetical protein [Fervidicella metallireducens]EYE89418.1 hypothetical protein Q428_02925 [Fervidicella metallireducens AeB]
MWLEVVYRPTSLFSLRKSEATNPAAKTLISPSPYSVKMALINACITFFSLDLALEKFELIRDLEILFNLPQYFCINNSFVKIQKEPKVKENGKAFQPTVAFREYIYYNDTVKIAFKTNNESEEKFLKLLLMRINYFGKRGSFFQYSCYNSYTDELPDGYCYLFTKESIDDNKKKILIKMDDFSHEAKFENISNYSESKAMRDTKIFLF